MHLYFCPHCEQITELRGELRSDLICDCGGVLEPVGDASDNLNDEYKRIEVAIDAWPRARS